MAKSTENVVFFRHGDLSRPVLKILDRALADDRHDVQIILRKSPEEHLSLHRADDEGLLLTHSSPGKSRSVWDDLRIKAARGLRYRDPDKHGSYYQHAASIPPPMPWATSW